MTLKLPAVVLSMLKQRGGTIDTELRATQARLVNTCKKHGYTPHASVIAFESAFGGLVIPDEGKIKKGEPRWLFGTYACLTAGGHTASHGVLKSGGKASKLVPVVNAPNDVIYYLDEQGRAYAKDTIEDVSPSFYADNYTSLVCRIIFDDAVFSRKESSLDLPGLQGEALCKSFSLVLSNEASGKDIRYFSDGTGDLLVVEEIKAKRTRFASATQAPLKRVRQSVISGSDKPTSPELIPFLGKTSVRMVSEQRTSLPDFFEHLPDLRELDVSINHLTTLPESLWRAVQITALDLSFNPLEALPEGIANMKALNSLSLRGCPLEALPEALAGAKSLTKLILTECEKLDIDAAVLVIAKLPKLKELSLPLSHSLTSLASLAQLPLKSLLLSGANVQHPIRLPSGFGLMKKLTDLRIEYADDIAQLPETAEDVHALRLLFAKRFTDDDIRQSALKQPSKLYLRAFADTL
jgi:hypothetical protein